MQPHVCTLWGITSAFFIRLFSHSLACQWYTIIVNEVHSLEWCHVCFHISAHSLCMHVAVFGFMDYTPPQCLLHKKAENRHRCRQKANSQVYQRGWHACLSASTKVSRAQDLCSLAWIRTSARINATLCGLGPTCGMEIWWDGLTIFSSKHGSQKPWPL